MMSMTAALQPGGTSASPAVSASCSRSLLISVLRSHGRTSGAAGPVWQPDESGTKRRCASLAGIVPEHAPMADENRPAPVDLAPDHDQPAPGRQAEMQVQPDSDLSIYKPADKLRGKVAVITGGDSGIGRAVAVAYAMEGADVAIAFNYSEDDAAETRRMVEEKGQRCLMILSDVTVRADRQRIVNETVSQLGPLDILVNNAAYFEGDGTLAELDEDGLRRAFDTNNIGYMLMAQAALPHLEATRGTIINTSSTTSILGKKGSLAYSSTKGAVNVFTKSLALELAEKGIRVNAVLPGPGLAAATGPPLGSD